MVVKLKVDQFTAGDMVFSVRRRFRPNVSYLKQFYTSGELTLEALNEMKKSKNAKLSNEYYSEIKEATTDNQDDTEYILEDIKKDVKEEVKEDIKEEVSQELPEKPRTFLEALTAAYTRNAPTDILRRTRKPKLPELTINQRTLDEYFKEESKRIDTANIIKENKVPFITVKERKQGKILSPTGKVINPNI